MLDSPAVYYAFIVLINILVFAIGATAFSFVNVLVRELKKEEPKIKGKSTCPLCGHEKRIRDMIPILSWMVHKGKCMYCFEKTTVREPIVEAVGGLLALALLPYYQLSLATITMFLLLAVLATITLIDADIQEIPPVLNIALGVLGVISYFTIPGGPSITSRIIGMFCIALPMYIVVITMNGFGGGDVKMMFAIGLFLGWKGTVFAFAVGVVLGGVYGMYLMLMNKAEMKSMFAFGPFLSVGIAVSAYAGIGTQLLDMYINSFRIQ